MGLRLGFAQICLGCLLALLFSPAQQAAEKSDSAANWYQVEVIIFARNAGQTDNTEVWRDQPQLSYPENLQVLRQYQPPTVLQPKPQNPPPPEPTPFAQLLETDAEITEEASDTALETPEHETSFSQFGQETTDNPAAQPETNGTAPDLTPIDIDHLPQRLAEATDIEQDPFVLLPQTYFQLNNLDQRIRRALDMRLLSHFAWRQPAEDSESAKPVFVQAGDQYGLSFEVEGMITLKENRYLHIENRFLYSKFKHRLLNNGEIDWAIFGSQKEVAPLDSLDTFDSFNRYSYGETGRPKFDPFADKQEYETELSAPLLESRRINEGEVHYLDHPLFGILLTVSAYEPPDPVLQMPDFDLDALPRKKPVPKLSVTAKTE